MSANPFPGMNPYLESRRFWSDVHHELISAIRAQIREQLPPGFIARLHDGDDEEYEPFIEIASAAESGHIVTIIEVLRPANKRAGPRFEEYRRKQEQVLQSETHLLEIDLLREGQQVIAVPSAEIAAQNVAWDYLVSLHRGGWGAEYNLWPIRLQDRLPRLQVPLSAGHSDRVLDLQAALERTWNSGGYGDSIHYAEEPQPPLSPENAKWADTLLRNAGLRT